MDRTKTLARSVLALGLAAPALGFAASDETIIEQIIVTAQKRAIGAAGRAVLGGRRERSSRSATRARPTSSSWRATSPASPSPISAPGRARSRSAASARARSCAISRRREGIGRRVPGRVGDLAWRCSRRTSTCSTCERFEVLRGPQGTLFGAGLVCGHGALHHAPAAARRSSKARPKPAPTPAPTPTSAAASSGVVNLPMGDTAALRVVGYYNELAGFIDSVLSGPRACSEDVNSGEKMRRARRAAVPAERESVDHAAHRLPEAGDRRLSAHRHLQHPRQSVHDDRAAGESRRARPGDADSAKASTTSSRWPT